MSHERSALVNLPDDEELCKYILDVPLPWQVVAEMTPKERGALMKFATSVTRAPLGGFAHLNPPFTLHRVRPLRMLFHCGWLCRLLECAWKHARVRDLGEMDRGLLACLGRWHCQGHYTIAMSTLH